MDRHIKLEHYKGEPMEEKTIGYCNTYLHKAMKCKWSWAATMDLVQLFKQESKQSDPNAIAILKRFYNNHTMNMLPASKRDLVHSENRALGCLELDRGENAVSYAMLCDGRKRVQIAFDKGIKFFPVREHLNPVPVGDLPSVSGLHVWTCTSVYKTTFTLSPYKPPSRLRIVLAPKVYKEGYLMTDHDIAYVLGVILHPNDIQPLSYKILIDNLKKSIDSPRGKRSSWDKWVPCIVNSDHFQGDHWMLVIFKIAEAPNLMLWDSWCNNHYSSKVDSYFNTQFGTSIEQRRTTVQQRDGWRCGFFASFWYIYVHFALINMQEGAYEFLSRWSPKYPPDGWEEFVFLLLKAREVTQDGDSSVHDLGIMDVFMASMSSETLSLSVLSSNLKMYIAKSAMS